MPEIIPILHNIRSLENVGSILRTAECLGVKKIIISGYTPNWLTDLPHIREKMLRKISKIALGTEKLLKIEFSENIEATIKSLKSANYKILALEQAENSIPLQNFQTEQNQNYALLLGEEVAGIDKNLLKKADKILEIPQFGKKESLNVASATAIALYELTKS